MCLPIISYTTTFTLELFGNANLITVLGLNGFGYGYENSKCYGSGILSLSCVIILTPKSDHGWIIKASSSIISPVLSINILNVGISPSLQYPEVTSVPS